MPNIDAPMVTTDPQHARLRIFGPPQEVAPDVFMHAAFVNTYAVRTPVGLLLIDPGFTHQSRSVHDTVRTWCYDPVHSAQIVASAKRSAKFAGSRRAACSA